MGIKFVVFGLSVSSSWGNGHATIWRGLCRALGKRGHEVVFFERDVPYYAAHRDLTELPSGRLFLYPDWQHVLPAARRELAKADVGMVTSYCPDGVAATDLVLSTKVLSAFYDLDTPVTLERVKSGEPVFYIGPDKLTNFQLVLSYTGGLALEELQTVLGARRTVPLYGSVDPEVHRPVPQLPDYQADLSYLGTYAADRQPALQTLFIEPARRLPDRKFLIGGSLYPQDFPWTRNSYYRHHVPPSDHPAFYCSSVMTLNVTRRAMAQMGYCPSGRLFEAASCGVPIISDTWEGLENFLAPGTEIIAASSTNDVVEALTLPHSDLGRIACRARERTLSCHTADARARDLESAIEASH